MGIIPAPAKVAFTDIATLPRPGIPFITYFLRNALGQATGQEFVWSDVANDYIPVGERDYNVIGTWDPRTNTPDYATTLTTNGDALVASNSSTSTQTTDVNGFDTWNEGDLLVRDNDIFFKQPTGAGLLNNLSDNHIPIFDGTNLADSSLSSDGTTTETTETFEAPQGTFRVGTTAEIKEVGGLPGFQSGVTDNLYTTPLQVLESQSVLPVTTDKAFRFAFGPQEVVENQSDDDTVMNNVTSFNLNTIGQLHLVRAFTFSFINSLTNFKMRFTRQSDGRAIKHFPSKAAWEDDTLPGATVTVPPAPPSETAEEALIRQRVEVYPGGFENATPFVFPASLPINIEWKADSVVNVNGDGTIPYHNVTIEPTTITELADMGDVLTAEGVRDIIAATLRSGAGITITEDDPNDTITISATGLPFAPPEITNFSINIPSRVDLNTDLNNQRTITFNVERASNIISLNLEVTTGDNVTLTVPTNDGVQNQSVTLSGIDTTSESTLTFRLSGQNSVGDPVTSNTVSIAVRNAAPQEFLYYGLSDSDNPADVAINTLTSTEITSGRSYTITAGPTTQGQYFILLTPDAETVSSIRDTVLDQDVTSIFTPTEDVRQINSENFDSYVVGPLNAGATENFIVRFN